MVGIVVMFERGALGPRAIRTTTTTTLLLFLLLFLLPNLLPNLVLMFLFFLVLLLLQWSRNEVLSGPQFFLSTLSILDDMAKV